MPDVITFMEPDVEIRKRYKTRIKAKSKLWGSTSHLNNCIVPGTSAEFRHNERVRQALLKGSRAMKALIKIKEKLEVR